MQSGTACQGKQVACRASQAYNLSPNVLHGSG